MSSTPRGSRRCAGQSSSCRRFSSTASKRPSPRPSTTRARRTSDKRSLSRRSGFRAMTTTAPVTHDPFADYALGEAYDELFDVKAQPRRPYKRLYKELMNLTPEELGRSKQKADLSFFNQGITFTVYGRKEGTERIFPHDLLPRIISGSDWDVIERGLTQRVIALNMFLKDIYHERRALRDRIIPAEAIYSSHHFRRQMTGVRVPRDAYVNVMG